MQGQAVAALDNAIQEFHGDRDRVYLTGLSMGGAGAWLLAAREPERFAALVIIAGSVTAGPMPASARESTLRENAFMSSDDPYGALAAKVKSVPIRLFHGSADMTVPVTESRQMLAGLRTLHAAVEYKEYEGVGHNSWDRAYAESELMPWLFAQRRQPRR